MIGVHFITFAVGFILDLLLGDPRWCPHIVVFIGKLISFLEKILYPKKRSKVLEFISGLILEVIVLAVTFAVTVALAGLAYRAGFIFGVIFALLIAWQTLALKGLKTESMKVYDALARGDVESARHAVSMIVGRDTSVLDDKGIMRAAVETVAENASDGVIAPMLFLCFTGPIGAVLYKAVNTMDSMIGYKNDRYLYFGRAAAKTDDILNLIPARLTAVFMIFCCMFADEAFEFERAFHTWRRDRYNHASPNSAQGESVMAGALGIRLAGDAVYFGKLVLKPYIGDDIREIEAEDIKRANSLLYSTALVAWLLGLISIILMELF